MIDTPLTFNVKADKVHCCFIMPEDQMKPADEYIHPCFAFANENGYIKNHKIAWQRNLAIEFANRYNTEVLGLTLGQAEAILISSMQYPRCPYPEHYEKNKELFEDIGHKLATDR